MKKKLKYPKGSFVTWGRDAFTVKPQTKAMQQTVGIVVRSTRSRVYVTRGYEATISFWRADFKTSRIP